MPRQFDAAVMAQQAGTADCRFRRSSRTGSVHQTSSGCRCSRNMQKAGRVIDLRVDQQHAAGSPYRAARAPAAASGAARSWARISGRGIAQQPVFAVAAERNRRLRARASRSACRGARRRSCGSCSSIAEIRRRPPSRVRERACAADDPRCAMAQVRNREHAAGKAIPAARRGLSAFSGWRCTS